ncbi:MAG: hypothetical protein JWQ07_76 [Ramlibacter sp.]|nr:hypothetical protein [Ramlibacter sp.]
MQYWLRQISRLLRSLSRAAVLGGGVGVLMLAGAPDAAAQPAQDRVRETMVKAAFLHKFASFVEWPPGWFDKPDSPLRIGILGSEPIAQDLSELAKDRDRDGRPVMVTRLKEGDSLAGYHILYLKAAGAARMGELLQQIPEGVLTVADSDGAHPRGSVISFFLEDGRVRFGISLDSATRQRLRLSSRLLAVARNVQGRLLPGDDALAQHGRVLLF